MIETVVKLSWGLLALVHVVPAAVLVRPALLGRLYGVAPTDDVGLLLTHRGALFLAVAAVCAYAVADPGARRAAGLVAAVSVVGFLVLYLRAGALTGGLRTVALTDVALLPPLVVVLWSAWRT